MHSCTGPPARPRTLKHTHAHVRMHAHTRVQTTHAARYTVTQLSMRGLPESFRKFLPRFFPELYDSAPGVCLPASSRLSVCLFGSFCLCFPSPHLRLSIASGVGSAASARNSSMASVQAPRRRSERLVLELRRTAGIREALARGNGVRAGETLPTKQHKVVWSRSTKSVSFQRQRTKDEL